MAFLQSKYLVLLSLVPGFISGSVEFKKNIDTNIVDKEDSAYLPCPPFSLNDVSFPQATVKVARNPAILARLPLPAVDPHPWALSPNLPNGCFKYRDILKKELFLWDKRKLEENQMIQQILFELFRDSENIFRLEPKFKLVFGCELKEFNEYGRSILGWMISFASLNLLNMIDPTEYYVTPVILESSFHYLYTNSQVSVVGKVLDSCSVLAFANTLPSIGSVYSFFLRQPTEKPLLPLAMVLREIRGIDFTHISMLVPLLEKGNEISDLIAKSNQIITIFNTNPTMNYVEVTHLFRTALQKFFIKCLPDYKLLGKANRFSVASLFIVLDNVTELKRLIETFPDLPTTIGNSMTLLQIAINAMGLESVSYLAALNPAGILSNVNGQQSPIVQAVVEGNTTLLARFLPYITSNNPVILLGYAEPCSLIRLAIRFGRADSLKKIISYFVSHSYDFNLREEFEEEFKFLIHLSGNDPNRTYSLIKLDIWKVLISTGLVYDLYGSESRSLLDSAVIDRNVSAAALIINAGGDVNYNCQFGPLRGNCLRYIRGDADMFTFLVSKDLDVNSDIVENRVDEDDHEINYPTKMTSIVHLLKNSITSVDLQFHEAILAEARRFSISVIQRTRDYGSQKRSSVIVKFSQNMLESKRQTKN